MTASQDNDSSYGMNDDDKHRAQALVNRLLREAGDKTAKGEYKAALTAVKKAKALDQANVFLLALERQIEQIEELAITGLLSDAQKADIMGSIPGLVSQASQASSALEKPDALKTSKTETAEEREARIAAGRWLKNQYFQRSHDFVREGEYDQALQELRKIFSIDDQDRVAREFELKIMQMLELRRRQPLVARPDSVQQQPAQDIPPGTSGPVAPEKEISVAPARRSSGVWIAVIVTVIVVVLAAAYFWNRQKSTPAVPQIHETVQDKNEETPIYPVPPAQVPADTTKQDTSATQ
jgi:hypothetical protein